MSSAPTPLPVYMLAAVSPVLSVASGVTRYVTSLVSHLEGTEFRGLVLGLGNGGTDSLPSALWDRWRVVTGRAGWAGWRYWQGLAEYIRTHGGELSAGLVHAHRPDYLTLLRQHADRPLATVCTLHGPHFLNVRRRWGRIGERLYEGRQRAGLELADVVIAVSTETERVFVELYPCLESRIRTIHVGVDTRRFHPQDVDEARGRLGIGAGERGVLFVGRMHSQKNLPLLLRAFASLTTRAQNASLWLVGDGPEQHTVRGMAQTLGVEHRCRFVGAQNAEQVALHMAAANALVLTSAWEGMPTVILEALACGLPCVTTRVGDVADAVIDGRTGYIVESEAEAVAEGIEKVLARPRQEWAGACAGMGRRFAWHIVARKIATAYSEAIEARPAQGGPGSRASFGTPRPE